MFARGLSLSLIFAFLVQTGYVNATVTECYSCDEYQVSLVQEDMCCAPQATDHASVSAKCCASEKSEKIFDGFVGQLDYEGDHILSNPVSCQKHNFVLIPSGKADRNSLKAPPERRSGVTLLQFISVFRL